MKSNKEYKYEYSDLNLFQTRVEILRGKYKEIILEFGSSHLVTYETGNDFYFDYTIYYVPECFNSINLKGNSEFESYLSKLLISIIQDRKVDKKEYTKLMKAASVGGTLGRIKIDPNFYPYHACKVPDQKLLNF